MTPSTYLTAPIPTPTSRLVHERDANGFDRSRPGDSRRASRQHRDESPSLPVRFPLGRLVATPGAISALERAGVDPVQYIARHATCDWGDVDAEDWAANDRALVDAQRLLSAYILPNGERLWILTEADRNSSCLLVPSEY
jgi:hypothetical protein